MCEFGLRQPTNKYPQPNLDKHNTIALTPDLAVFTIAFTIYYCIAFIISLQIYIIILKTKRTIAKNLRRIRFYTA